MSGGSVRDRNGTGSSMAVRRVMRAIDGLDLEEQDDLRLALVEILDPEERLDLFDDLGDMYCTMCGESLPDADSKEPDHACEDVAPEPDANGEDDDDDSEEGIPADEDLSHDRDVDAEDEVGEPS